MLKCTAIVPKMQPLHAMMENYNDFHFKCPVIMTAVKGYDQVKTRRSNFEGSF